MASPAIQFDPVSAKSFAETVMDRSGQNLNACYQCKRCAAGCPVAEETGYVTPNRLIRLIVLGDRDGALNNELVWRCVSCYTCGTRCPNNIHTARITETLKQIAKEEHEKILRPKIGNFHSSFVGSAVRWGRLNEIEFMQFYEIKNTLNFIKNLDFKGLFNEVTSLTKLGLAMLLKKRMPIGFKTTKGRSEIKLLMKKAKQKKQ